MAATRRAVRCHGEVIAPDDIATSPLEPAVEPKWLRRHTHTHTLITRESLANPSRRPHLPGSQAGNDFDPGIRTVGAGRPGPAPPRDRTTPPTSCSSASSSNACCSSAMLGGSGTSPPPGRSEAAARRAKADAPGLAHTEALYAPPCARAGSSQHPGLRRHAQQTIHGRHAQRLRWAI